MSLPVFVINLSRSIERRQRSADALAALGTPIEFVEAVDGRSLGDLPVLSTMQPHMGRVLTRGEVGCLESHLAVLGRIVREGLPMALVCEDDIRPGDDCARVLRALTQAPSNAGRGGWDILLLGHHSARYAPELGAATCVWSSALTERHRMARVAEFAMGAYAYVVTRRGAERLLALARPLRMPMDWVTGYAVAAGARLFAVTPPCITPDLSLANGSTIDGRETGPPPRPARAERLRTIAGCVWLSARRLGLWPDSYARRY
jgi:glycosyl transferase family 25